MGRATGGRHPIFSRSNPAKYRMRLLSPCHRERLAALVEERRRTHPHAVRQAGLLRSRVNDDQFLRRQDERRRWIAEHCKHSFWVDTLIEGGKEIGKLYRFADFYDAVWFRCRF